MPLLERLKFEQRDYMKIKCPVALCEWEGKTHAFWKHIEEYKITWKDVMDSGFSRSESHERWANYFFKEIWSNPNLDDKTKWTNIAVAYVNQMKNQSKMGQHKGKLFSNSSGRIDIHDGKYFIDGQEYTPEEFQKRVPSINVPQGQKPPFETIKDITGDLRITHEGKDYTIDEFRKLQREKLEMLKK